ncbi:MAG: fused MFS/spermidine synthase [Candidatus Gracilibacteria bacterium]|jgi:spermidine synthase|nr:fused MFS/spermidine synthase [Candidatus Gracilibacteria bacterium]
MKNKNLLLSFSVFFCGAIVMIFELAGSRVLGPYFGTSIFVWTSIIGIILGSMSFGYFFGGKLADKKPSFSYLALVVFLSGVAISLSYFIKEPFLVFMSSTISDTRLSSILAAVVLFTPASLLLGMVSPYAVKLSMSSLKTSGRVVGRLYSLSTAGSIFGTFLAGFYLIPTFGTNMILILISVFLFFISFALSSPKIPVFKILVFCFMAGAFFSIDTSLADKIDVDTPYNRVWIYDYEYGNTGRLVKKMGINNENHSSMFLDSDELVNEYTKYYHLVRFFNPDFKKTMMMGGAAYSYPKDFLRKYSDATIDVVEIDPKMTQLAKKYFRLQDDDRLRIFHEDGRVFLNRNTEKYDAIFGDAFTSKYSVPYQLSTVEAVQKQYDSLNENGVVILNLISAFEGEKSLFLQAEYKTFKEVFPQVFIFKVRSGTKLDNLQNIILVALKSENVPDFSLMDDELASFLTNLFTKKIPMDMPVLTDDFAPVDYYMNKAL